MRQNEQQQYGYHFLFFFCHPKTANFGSKNPIFWEILAYIVLCDKIGKYRHFIIEITLIDFVQVTSHTTHTTFFVTSGNHGSGTIPCPCRIWFRSHNWVRWEGKSVLTLKSIRQKRNSVCGRKSQLYLSNHYEKELTDSNFNKAIIDNTSIFHEMAPNFTSKLNRDYQMLLHVHVYLFKFYGRAYVFNGPKFHNKYNWIEIDQSNAYSLNLMKGT